MYHVPPESTCQPRTIQSRMKVFSVNKYSGLIPDNIFFHLKHTLHWILRRRIRGCGSSVSFGMSELWFCLLLRRLWVFLWFIVLQLQISNAGKAQNHSIDRASEIRAEWQMSLSELSYVQGLWKTIQTDCHGEVSLLVLRTICIWSNKCTVLYQLAILLLTN